MVGFLNCRAHIGGGLTIPFSNSCGVWYKMSAKNRREVVDLEDYDHLIDGDDSSEIDQISKRKANGYSNSAYDSLRNVRWVCRHDRIPGVRGEIVWYCVSDDVPTT